MDDRHLSIGHAAVAWLCRLPCMQLSFEFLCPSPFESLHNVARQVRSIHDVVPPTGPPRHTGKRKSINGSACLFQRLGTPLGPHLQRHEGNVLRRRSPFVPQPARCFSRFHRIGKRHHALMKAIASGHSNVRISKLAETGVNRARHHHHRFALLEKLAQASQEIARQMRTYPQIRTDTMATASRGDRPDRPDGKPYRPAGLSGASRLALCQAEAERLSL